MTERSAGLPSHKQVIELLGGEFARAGYDIEDVVVDATVRPPRITLVADGDDSPDLDAIAALSRTASELLDRAPFSLGGNAPYVLEVTSPGVDRPLRSAKHYRRAHGRRVELTLADGSRLTGRLGQVVDGAQQAATVHLVVNEGGRDGLAVRELPIDTIANAVVQVEFSPPNRRELELAGRSAGEAEA